VQQYPASIKRGLKAGICAIIGGCVIVAVTWIWSLAFALSVNNDLSIPLSKEEELRISHANNIADIWYGIATSIIVAGVVLLLWCGWKVYKLRKR